MSDDGRFYELGDREQPKLYGPSLREAIADDAEVLALDAAVAQLDFGPLEARYQRVGHPAFPPRAMFKVLVYGYASGLRSSRQLDRACRREDAFRFLAHGLTPDFRTLCRFRRQHAAALGELFRQTVRLCPQAGLVSLGQVAVDGTKLRANRSGRTLAAEQVWKQALSEAEEQDADIPPDSEQLQAEAARFMKQPAGIKPGYHAQLAVDSAQQVIVAQELDGQASDQGRLPELVEQVERTCGAPPQVVTADGGYYAQAALEQLEAGPSQVYVPAPTSGSTSFEWLAQPGAYRCPQGHWLLPGAQRGGRQIYRTHRCGRCPQAQRCGVKGHVKELHVPLTETALGRLAQRMSTPAGQALYAARARIVEPVFGQFKHSRGFRRLLLRGRTGASAEWSLMCIAHNLGKWVQALRAGPVRLRPQGELARSAPQALLAALAVRYARLVLKTLRPLRYCYSAKGRCPLFTKPQSCPQSMMIRAGAN